MRPFYNAILKIMEKFPLYPHKYWTFFKIRIPNQMQVANVLLYSKFTINYFRIKKNWTFEIIMLYLIRIYFIVKSWLFAADLQLILSPYLNYIFVDCQTIPPSPPDYTVYYSRKDLQNSNLEYSKQCLIFMSYLNIHLNFENEM